MNYDDKTKRCRITREGRYELVIATSKRARQIAQGAEPLVKTDDVAPDSIAADEIDAGKVKVC